MPNKRPLIDEDGRLFGAVNVVDALVVLVLCCVVVAGVSLVIGTGTESEPAPIRYATVSYTAPLLSDGVALDKGETIDPLPAGEPLTAVDVVRSFGPNGAAHVVARVQYRDSLSAGRVRTDGIYIDEQAPRYGGDKIRVLTHSYRTDADILGVAQHNETLRTRDVSVRVKVNRTTAEALEAGTVASVGSDSVATVERVTVGADETPSVVSVRLIAWNRRGTPYFGGQALRVGNDVTIVTDGAVVSGSIRQVDSDDRMGGPSDDEI